MAQEALVDERLQYIQVGAADLLGCVEGAAAGEDGEATEELLFVVVEQVV